MSKVNKRKHVMKEMQTDDFDPPESNQRICRILSSRGNNLHEVESAEPFTGTSVDTVPPSTDPTNTTTENNDNITGDGSGGGGSSSSDACCQFLVSMPTKFRKNVWVKRGDFVIAAPIDEGDKVKAEIVRILTTQHIKEFKKMGIWPEKFTSKERRAPGPNDADGNACDNDNDLFVNTNRAHHAVESSSDSDSSDNSDTDASDADSEDNANDTEDNETNGKDDTGRK